MMLKIDDIKGFISMNKIAKVIVTKIESTRCQTHYLNEVEITFNLPNLLKYYEYKLK